MGRTHEALLRAEKKYQGNLSQKRLLERIEPLLVKFRLGEAEIFSQNFPQLKNTLVRLNGLIKKPEYFKKLNLGNNSAPKMEFKRNILKILIKRKELVLGYIDLLVTNNKNKAIKRLINKVSNKKLRVALGKNFNDLEALNKFLINEHIKILKLKSALKTK